MHNMVGAWLSSSEHVDVMLFACLLAPVPALRQVHVTCAAATLTKKAPPALPSNIHLPFPSLHFAPLIIIHHSPVGTWSRGGDLEAW